MPVNLTDKIKVIFQTDNEAVIYKPAGIATQLSNDIKGTSLESILKIMLDKKEIYFPHRLDRITQGLILVAFDKKAVAYYNKEIKNKRFDKFYLAKVETKISNPENLIGVHKRFIKVDGKISRIVKSGGLPSFLEILSVESIEDNVEFYHVLIKLITGRLHQIRVMLADLGIPLAGDFLYNPESKYKNFYLESVILKFIDTEGIKRTMSANNFKFFDFEQNLT